MRGGTSTQRKNIVRRWTVAADVRTKREPNNIALAVLFGPPTSCQFCRSSPSVLHYIAIANVVIIVVRGREKPQYHMPLLSDRDPRFSKHTWVSIDTRHVDIV